MSEDYQRIQVTMGASRRRQWTTEAHLRIIEESSQPDKTVSSNSGHVAPTASPMAGACSRSSSASSTNSRLMATAASPHF